MLDRELLSDTFLRLSAKKNAVIEEMIKAKEAEPVKTIVPLEAKKTGVSCPVKWEESNNKERLRYCKQCQLPVYNFDGLEQAEAEAFIFKHENRQNAVLYKRDDGKFMTSLCPVQKKKETEKLILAVAAIIAVILILAVFSSSPPPAAPTASPIVAPTPADASSTAAGSSESRAVNAASQSPESHSASVKGIQTVESKDGAYHYELGKPLQVPRSALQPVKPVLAPKAPDPDEDGQFWQYADGSPGEVKPVPAPVQPVQQPSIEDQAGLPANQQSNSQSGQH